MSPLARYLLARIAFYQANRDLFPRQGCCRLRPTCSVRAAELLRAYGAVRGVWRWLAYNRRCRRTPAGVTRIEERSTREHPEPPRRPAA